MDAMTMKRMEARARIMKALAHPTRLFLMETIAQGERPVAELARLAGADVSTVSKHLTLLKAVGLAQERREGTQVFHRLACPCALDFFTCLEGVLQANVQSQMELVGKEVGRGR
jgi:ArsR family transcriptional regulator